MICQNRSRHEGKPMPHLFTSRKRTKIDGTWAAWEQHCSWCGKAQ